MRRHEDPLGHNETIFHCFFPPFLFLTQLATDSAQLPPCNLFSFKCFIVTSQISHVLVMRSRGGYGTVGAMEEVTLSLTCLAF